MGDGRELVPLRTGFDVVLRGYRRGPVQEYVRAVEEELRLLAADRDAHADLAQALATEVEQLRAENARLHERLDRVCAGPIDPTALQDRLRRMVEIAKEEAAEVAARAEAAAEHCWTTAEEAAGRLRARYEESIAEVDRTRRAMEVEHLALLRQARVDATVMTTEADRNRQVLDDQAARRRARIESDFDVAMSTRRTEAMREVAERKVAAEAAAARVVRAATDEAARRIDVAQRDVDRLRDLRRHLATQLTGARAVLTDAGPLLAPVPAEAETLDETARPASPTIPQQRERGAAPTPTR